MNKKIIILLALILMVSSLMLLTAFSEEKKPDVLLAEAFASHQRPGSVFDHDQHMEIVDGACYVCHHLYKDGKLVPEESSEDMSCSECHPVKPDKGQTALKEAYHLNCKGCHEKEGKGPLACGECHVRF